MRGGIDPVYQLFRPGDVGGVEIKKNFSSGDGNVFSSVAAGPRGWPGVKLSPRAASVGPSQSSITQRRWGFHTLRGGIDPGDLRFCPRVVGVVEVWKDF